VVTGDASGHGIGAGLLMAIVNATLKLAIELDPSPAQVARLVNRVLVRTGDHRAFMTLFYGLLDPATGHLDYVCAGHPFPLLRRSGGDVLELGTGCLPLGLRDHLRLQPGSVELCPGDLLVLFSDGIPEAAHRASGTDFGFDRLRHLVEPGGTPQQVHHRILADLDLFLRGEPRADDVSLVVVGREVELPPVPGTG
jgi:serine phosphatase RsbU (regulator of sigma subunit)